MILKHVHMIEVPGDLPPAAYLTLGGISGLVVAGYGANQTRLFRITADDPEGVIDAAHLALGRFGGVLAEIAKRHEAEDKVQAEKNAASAKTAPQFEPTKAFFVEVTAGASRGAIVEVMRKLDKNVNGRDVPHYVCRQGKRLRDIPVALTKPWTEES